MMRQFPALRGIAILLVVLNHSVFFATSAPAEYGLPVPGGAAGNFLIALGLLGWLAVPTFLFISGNFFAYAAQGSPPKLSYKIVWVNFLHLLWPYLIWSCIYYLVLFFVQGTHLTVGGYIKSLLVGFPFNFVPLILFFYLISPILIWLFNRIGWLPILLIIGAYQLFLILALDSEQYGLVLPGWTHYLVVPALARTMADWGIYFPLGMALRFNARQITPWLQKLKWPLIALTVAFYVIIILHASRILRFPLSRHIYPLTFVLLTPLITRDSIPFTRWFENVGKKAYALYMIHLTLLVGLTALLEQYFPQVFGYPVLLVIAFFLLAVFIPLGFINLVARIPNQHVYRYVFG